MAVRLFMDHNVRRPITAGLRLRDVDALTAFEDGSHELEDPEVLDRATELGRVLYSEDDDFLAEGAKRQRQGIDFTGVIYGHQSLEVRVCIDDLELAAKASEPEDLRNQVLYLPLR